MTVSQPSIMVNGRVASKGKTHLQTPRRQNDEYWRKFLMPQCMRYTKTKQGAQLALIHNGLNRTARRIHR